MESPAFAGLSRLERHRLVHATLGDIVPRIHALAQGIEQGSVGIAEELLRIAVDRRAAREKRDGGIDQAALDKDRLFAEINLNRHELDLYRQANANHQNATPPHMARKGTDWET